jgi:hypothetical protein
MKVLITYTERITRVLEKEVEMTKEEYKKYLKMSTFEQDEKYDLCSSCDDEHFQNLEILSINTEIVK